MLLKLLFTFGVILIGLMVIKHKTAAREEPRPILIEPIKKKRPFIEVMLAITVALMLLGVSAFVYYEWTESQQTMQIKVINANDGRTVEYHAKQGEINADERYFITLDGRRITLSNIERLEISRDFD